MSQNAREKFIEDLCSTVDSQTLKKVVFSKPTDNNVVKSEGKLVKIKGEVFLQIETFTSDGKALHKNVQRNGLVEEINGFLANYGQIDIITLSGNGELLVSKKGKETYIGRIKSTDASIDVEKHDKEKQLNILHEGTRYEFLVKLGVTDEDGRIFDKKRPKFRQIDRFLQYVREIYPKMPPDGELYVLDLCCGKSYLTFAVYWYLTEVMRRDVKMTGVDLKKDVIAFCSQTAREIGCGGLHFICGDILKFEPEREPDLVLSLHACDIATDIVLTTAARLGAKVILSTPCCQHQVNSELNGDSLIGKELLPILEHSLLKQKLAVAITDALRCKRLQSSGYSVNVTELIDPEDTPKNIMIRAVKTNMSENKKQQYKNEFLKMSELCGVDIFPGKDKLL